MCTHTYGLPEKDTKHVKCLYHTTVTEITRSGICTY